MPVRPPTHKPPGALAPQERKRQFDRERGRSENRKLYTYAWSQSSKLFLLRNPLCVSCLEQGLTAEAKVTDHIIPHKGDRELFWNPRNWQALCKPCHDRKSGEEAHKP